MTDGRADSARFPAPLRFFSAGPGPGSRKLLFGLSHRLNSTAALQ